MFSTLYLSLQLLLAISALAKPLGPSGAPQLCGNILSDEQVRHAEAQFQQDRIPAKEGKTFAVNVNWHVISSDNTEQGGNIPDSVIATQIQVMNTNFAGSGVTFTLNSTDRTVNTAWTSITQGGAAQTAMKKQLRKGGAGDLNVYSVNSITSSYGGLLGYATFPDDYNGNPQDDGIVLDLHTLPGGTSYGTNTGKILVHETGHWVGLYHTFQGGCYGAGDEVADTPPQKLLQTDRSCNEKRDSCPGDNLYDPVHNHMDYTDDSCRNQFTAGQNTRLADKLATYRGL